MKELEGRVALVTGGTRGIGAAIAKALANAGADVAITYMQTADKARDVVSAIEATGRRATAFRHDQADSARAAELVARVIDHFGTLDILVNNAAVFRSYSVDDPDIDKEGLDQLYATNLFGVIAMIRAGARVMKPGGRIISISSNVAHRATLPGFADYIATKSAVTGFSKGAARDLGPRGITVNIVASGPTITEMNPDDTDMAISLKQLSSVGRYGRPEEIAGAVVYLAGPRASYITGTVIAVDGGIDA